MTDNKLDAAQNNSIRFKIITCCIFLFILGFFLIPQQGVCSPNHSSGSHIRPVILPDLEIIKRTVKKGDTISSILNPHLNLRTIYQISDQSAEIFSLSSIKIGQQYKIILQDKNLARFEYDINTESRLVVQMKKDEIDISKKPIDYDIELTVVSSEIRSSLFESVRKSGESIELATKLSDIFAWDIDFIRDIQSGDSFRVLVEKRYRDRKFSGYGKIHAAFFMNNGSLYKAFLHKDSQGRFGYYDENGKSLQKAFLKAPLAFSRISSKFTRKRLHPIFKEYRPHPGVDYAAPKGTPIKTVGDGVVTRAGFNKGLGNYIEIRHPNGYITSYNHMCRFSRAIRKGLRVKQGDVIGYVGMTGYATGPHLDFRMKKDGMLVDPLKHKSPPATPVDPDEIDQFMVRTRQLSRQIHMADALASQNKNSI